MVSKQPYQNLDHALKHFRSQVSESISYALEQLPALDSPEKIFNYLKPRLTYKKDPKGIELFQTLPTLLDNNWHGITGAGDCDCFTIAALSTLLANGFTDSGIVLAGRSPLVPVHIWAYTDVNGERLYLDLTNKIFNTTRYYPYLQHVPYKLNQKEKAMILELAEGGKRRNRGRVLIGAHFRRFPLHENAPGVDYVYLPSQGVHARADMYDNMSAGEFQQFCLSEGVELEEIAELSKGRAARKAAKEVKKDKRVARKAAKPRNVRKMVKAEGRATVRATRATKGLVKQEGKSALRTSRGVAKEVRGDARVIRAQDPNRGKNFASVINTMFAPQQPEQAPEEYYEPEEQAGYEPQYEVQDPTALLYPDQQPEYVEAEEVYQEEPAYEMAEGFSITKRDVVTGLAMLVTGVAIDRLVVRPLFGR